MAEYGLEQSEFDQPTYLDVLQSVPGAWTTTAWNIGRVQNTIYGGTRRTLLPRFVSQKKRQLLSGYKGGMLQRRSLGYGGSFSEGFRQTMSPRNFRRLSSAANINPAADHIYTPFNFLAKTGNVITGGNPNRFLKGKVAEYVGSAQGAIRGSLGVGEGERAFSPGTLGRVATIDKMLRAEEFSSKQFLRFSQSYRAMGASAPLANSGLNVAASFLNTIDSSVSGRAAGYIYGATASRMGWAADDIISHASGFAKVGAEAGVKALSERKLLGKAASYAGSALRGASILGNIVLVHDLAMIAGKTVGGALKAGANAMDSVKGSIDKPLMGMGFKDNSVAATSRQRGVMAIQNSQLNARSVLGSEASALAAHFG